MSVQGVLGTIARDELGVTLTHEHLSLRFDKFYRPPPKVHEDKFNGDMRLDNIAYIRQYPYSSRKNLDFYGTDFKDIIVSESKLFKAGGGGTIVENTSWGLGRDLSLMERVSKEAKINIIAGTGHYVAEVQPESTLSQTVEELYTIMKKELTEGCLDNPSFKCGFIGEVGSSWPIHDFEKRCIEATGLIQSELKCPVSFHPGRHQEAPAEILRRYSEAGGNVQRAVMSHLDRTFPTLEATLEFSELGSYCQFDLFGTEVSYYQLCPSSDMISDAQRIDRLMALIGDGKGRRVLASHDIHTRHRLVHFGGHGYAHIPIQGQIHMSAKGIQDDDIKKIMVENPATWLTGA